MGTGGTASRRKTIRRAVLLGTALALLVWAFSPSGRLFDRKREIVELKRQVAEYREKNDRLRWEAERLNSDQYLELLARKELGLVRPGQQPYILLSSAETVAPSVEPKPAPPEKSTPPKGFLESLLSTLGELTN